MVLMLNLDDQSLIVKLNYTQYKWTIN